MKPFATTATAIRPNTQPALTPCRRAVVWFSLISFVAQPLIVTAQVVADPGAGKYRPTVEAAPNGVPLVQITAPTGGGVSRNQYSDYSPDQRGVVLNNSNVVVQTQQAGWIVGNPNLTGSTARIILNEVTSTNPSNLRGYTEVAGSKADVIIANPNGITCNGCGFINTSRGVLTTGTPVFGGDGSLNAFRVTGGNIAFQGDGMIGTGADQIDLIARAVQVNADLWAKNLNVVTGANQVDYATLAATTLAGTGAAPTVSIDVAALGGMYANKIRLVGTEAGVGVANAGKLMAQAGDIGIDSAGRVVNTGTFSAAGNTDIAATGLTNNGTIDARQRMNLATTGDIDNTGTLSAGNNLLASAATLNSTGTLAAGVLDDGRVAGVGNLTVATTGALVATGMNAAGGDLSLQGASLDLRGADNSAGNDLTLTATAGNIDNRGARASAGGRAAFTAAADIDNRNSGSITARDITLAATGALANEGGAIEAGNTLSVAAASINNRSGWLANTGTGASTVNAAGAIDNTLGSIGGNGALTVAAASLDNAGGEVKSVGKLTVATTGNLTNASGTLRSGAALDIASDATLDNTDGRIEAETTAAIKAETVDNSRGRIANTGTGTTTVEGSTRITNASGLIGGNGDVEIRGGAIENASGALVAGNDLGLTATTVANSGGLVEATRDLKLVADALSGAGTVLAGRDIDARFSGNFTHDAGATMKANRNLALSAVGAVSNSGDIEAVSDLTVNASSLDNRSSGTLNANNTSIVASGSIANAGRIEGNTLATTSDSFTNTGTVIGDSVTINANNLTNSGAAAGIYATTALDLLIANAVANLDGAVVYSLGDLNIGASTRRDVDGYLADASASFTNSSGIVEAEGALRISAAQITNKRSTLDIQWTAERTGAYTDSGANHYTTYYSNEYVGSGTTAEGKLLSGADTWLKGNILHNEYSTIAAGGNLNVNAASVTNTGRALMEKQSDRGYTDNWQWVVVGSHRCGFLWLSRCDDWGWRNYAYPYNQETTYQIGSVDANMTAGQRVAGVAGSVSNQTVSSTAIGGSSSTLGANGTSTVTGGTGTYTPTLPTAGLYRTHPEPGQRYLIETDPRFASFKNFISSDYMLSRLPFDPQGTQKRLGDGAYEQKVITDQIVQQTGRRFLAGYASAEAEFQALMESGLAAAETFNLTPGIALTGAQMAALTHDMVWMVEQDVTLPNGIHDRVLVPVVYLTRAHSEDLKPNGALIAGTDLQLQINGSLANSGTLKGSNRLAIAATDIANRGGRIQSNDTLALNAANDLSNQSGRIAGRRVAIVAGRDLKSERLTEALQLASVATTRIHTDATLSASEDLNLSAGRDLALIAARTESGGDTRLQAGRNLNVGTVAASESVANGNGGKSVQTNLGSKLTSGGKLTLIAANDATLTTAELTAGQDLTVAGGGNVSLAATKDSRQSNFSGRGTRNRQLDETVRGSQLNAGGQINLVATDLNQLVGAAPTAAGVAATAPERNLSLEAANLNSQSGAITLAADGNVTVKEASERHEAMSETRTSSRGFFSSKSSVDRSESARSDVIGTNITGDSISLQSGSDLTVRGSNITATKDLALSAGRDVSIDAATASSASSHYHEEKKSGISASFASGISIGSASAKQSDKAKGTTAVVSELAGQNVRVEATRDANVVGARVLADGDIAVLAGRDVKVLAAQNTYSEEHTAESKSSSLMLAAGFAPRQTIYGTTRTSSQSQGKGNTATAALLSANTGNLAVTAGTDAAQHANTGAGNVTSQGADLIAGKEVRIEGNAVNLLASEANSQLDSKTQTKSVTVGAALAGTVGGVITQAYDMAKAAHDGTGNSRLDGAMALKAGYDAYKAIDGAGKALAVEADGAAAANGAKGNGSAFGVSFSVGTSSSQSESHDQSHNERGTNVQAENIAVKARETDLTAVGAKIEAQKDVTLEAARDLRLLAATNTQSLETSNKSSNASVGVTFGMGQQSGISFQIGASQAKGKSEGSETTYDNTRVTAGETLALKSGADTTLKGAQVGGKRIEADIGGKLAIETLQDQSQYKSQQSSSGFSLSLCIPPICYGTSTGSISAAQQKIDHSYQSAVGQSGIAAGERGFDIQVGEATTLKGGAITSTADAAQNRLATKSLSYEDLTNRQQTSASSMNIALSGGMDVSKGLSTAPSFSPAGQAASNLLANLAGQQGLPKNGSEQSQTLAVISPATITLTGTDETSRNAADTLTARNPATANQALTNTLKLQDAARMQQQLKESQQNAQAASLIGQVAAGIIGDLSTAMQKPKLDAELRQYLDAKQADGKPLTNADRYDLARLDKEGMTADKAAQTLNDPAVLANFDNWKDGSANKVILHGLAGVITAKVGGGSAFTGAASGAINEALIPEMSKFLEDRGVRAGSEEYKGYMQLGSALLGAGIGAVAKGTGGAALGATVAHNATTYNFLGHADKAERDRLKAKSQSGQKLSPEESARLVYLEAADHMSDGLLEKYRAGGREALSKTELENLSIYLGQYKLQDGASATNTLIQNGPQASYSYPFAGTTEMQLAYMDKPRADKSGWDRFLSYFSGRSISADEKTFNQARINAALYLNTAPNESFLPTSIKREGMFAEIDAIRNSALATTGYLGATFIGADADTRRNLTLTLSNLSDIGSSFILPKTSISPVFGKTTAAAEELTLSAKRTVWVEENAGMSQKARDYNDSASGARSNPDTKMGLAPALERKMSDGSVRLVKFDGVDGEIMVDRKISVVTTDKAKDQALRQSEALNQNGLTGRWEVSSDAQATRAIKMLNDLGISNIQVKVVKP